MDPAYRSHGVQRTKRGERPRDRPAMQSVPRVFFFVFSRDETQRSGTQAEGNDVLQFWAVCNEGGSVNL